MTKYDPRKNAEGYNDPTHYAAEKHMMAQIRGKQARVAGGYFENIISASCDYYLSRGLAKIEKTPEPMKPLGAKNRKGQFLACYTKQAQPDYGGTLKGGRSIYFEAKHTDDERIEQRGDKFHIDLKEINRLWLLRAGIDPARIDVHPDCTKCHPERYWSHRAMGEKRGGMAAMICLTEDML